MRSAVVSLFHLLLICALSEQQFSITGCQKETAYYVLDNNQSSLTCTGLQPQSNIYWSFTGPSTNGTEIRLGECYGERNGANPWNCNVLDKSYNITRPASNFTTLRFVHNVSKIHGGLIKCSQFNNHSGAQAYCAVRESGNKWPEFRIPDCSSGSLDVSKNQSVSLTCTGLWPVSNIYWSITGPPTIDAEVRLGDCRLCYPDCSATPCVVVDMRYNITRPRFDVTTLEFLGSLQGDDRVTVKCSQFNNATAAQASCTIMILQGRTTQTTGTQTTTNNTREASGTSASPMALVAGGVGAAALVVIVIVVVVVVVVVRRTKRKRPTGSEENVHTSGTEKESSYAGLHMSDIGLRSIYSGIGNSNTHSQPETEAASSNYKTMETSDDGLRLVYTEARHTNTDTQSHASPEGAYVSLEMSDNTLTSANTEVDDNENKLNQPTTVVITRFHRD